MAHDGRAVTTLRIMIVYRNVFPAKIEVLLNLSFAIASTGAHVSTHKSSGLLEIGEAPADALYSPNFLKVMEE